MGTESTTVTNTPASQVTDQTVLAAEPTGDGVVLVESGGKCIFYGSTPIAQRSAGSNHSTSNVATSASFGATQVAVIQEIMNTLQAYGLWSDH